MSGDIKQQLSNLHAENAYLKGLVANLSRKPTLRDRFAMAALAVVGANTAWQRPIDTVEAAGTAYGIADEMMKQRGEPNDAQSA
jgi:hypothetical protein